MKHLARVMGESGQMNTVFFAGNRFGRFALLYIKDLDSLIVASSDQVIALVVEVEGGHVCRRICLGISKGLEQISELKSLNYLRAI